MGIHAIRHVYSLYLGFQSLFCGWTGHHLEKEPVDMAFQLTSDLEVSAFVLSMSLMFLCLVQAGAIGLYLHLYKRLKTL